MGGTELGKVAGAEDTKTHRGGGGNCGVVVSVL